MQKNVMTKKIDASSSHFARETLAEDLIESAKLSEILSPDANVGSEIRGLRKSRGMTLDQLSEAAQLSKGHLSQLERGVSSASVRSLHAISRALGVTVSWFFPKFHEGEDDLRDIVVRKETRRTLRFKSGIQDELLSPNLSRNIELLRSTLPPGAKSGDGTYSHKGDEAGIILSGELDLWIGERHVKLSEGDSFAFDSTLPHRYENRGTTDVLVIWVNSPPSF